MKDERIKTGDNRGSTQGRQHLVLVPGFGGFDALGSLRYYHGVTEVLRAFDEVADVAVNYFPNLPTASVQTRAKHLAAWLAELRRRHAIGPGDGIHLIGHSTGGLDIRQLLRDLREQDPDGLLEVVHSAQFLSTPHHGTMLAHHVGSGRVRAGFARGILRGAYESLRALREEGAGVLGQVLRVLVPSSRAPDWIDAGVDALAGCSVRGESEAQADARTSYFEMLHWLLNMATDLSAITDLDPVPPPGAPLSPAHVKGTPDEQQFLEERGVRLRSIVTVAPPPMGIPRTLFALCYQLTAFKPTPLFNACPVQSLWAPGRERMLEPAESDGIVNSVSQAWPDPDRSRWVEADHADVIGHFQSSSTAPRGVRAVRQYDLFNSQSAFGEAQFQILWEDLGRFALQVELPHARRAGNDLDSRPSPLQH